MFESETNLYGFLAQMGMYGCERVGLLKGAFSRGPFNSVSASSALRGLHYEEDNCK